jgi:hypothetical protein
LLNEGNDVFAYGAFKTTLDFLLGVGLGASKDGKKSKEN